MELLLQTRRLGLIVSVLSALVSSESQAPSPAEDVIKQLQATIQKQQEDFHDLQKSFLELKADLENEREEKRQCQCLHYDQRAGKITDKRADDTDPLTAVVNQVSQRMDDVSAEIETLKAANAATGSTYVRWGNSACGGESQLVYSGVIGGSHYSHSGGATNPLCLPMNPTFSTSSQGTSMVYGYAALYGAEYETNPESSYNLDAVCAVCRAPSTTTIMIPATTSCSPGWSLEYSGYIMADRPDDGRAGTQFICVDGQLEGRAGSQGSNNNEMVLYYTLSHCGSLPCPPYEEGRVVECAVCSK